MAELGTTCCVVLDSTTGSHTLVRIIPRAELDRPMEVTADGAPGGRPVCARPVSPSVPLGFVSLDSLNGLLMARNEAQFLRACEQFPALQRRSQSLRDNDLLLSLGELQMEISQNGRLRAPDSSRIKKEIFLDPAFIGSGPWLFGERSRYGKQELATYLEQHGLISLSKELSSLLGGGADYVAVLEPLEDFVLIRSLMGISIRLASLYHSEPGAPRLLERAGFLEIEPDVPPSEEWELLVELYGTITSKSFVAPIGHELLMYNSEQKPLSPLVREVTSRASKSLHVRTLKTCPEIKLVQATEHRYLGTSKKNACDHIVDWSYLVIEAERASGGADCPDQTALMEMLINSLGRAQAPCSLSVLGSQDDVAYCALDALSACWNLYSHHPGHYFFMCEHCGKSMLAENNGTKKKYCSDSCRAAAHNYCGGIRKAKAKPGAVDSWKQAMEAHFRVPMYRRIHI